MRGLRFSILLCVSLALVGCSTVAQKLSASTLYKRDIELSINDKYSGIGAVIVPKASSYTVRAKLGKGNFDFVIFDSCAQYYSLKEDQGDDFEATFKLKPGLEDFGACSLAIESFDKAHSRDAFGIIIFKFPEWNLTGKLECNNQVDQNDTVTYCEQKDAHPTPKPFKISFSEPVYVGVTKEKPECVKPVSADSMDWTFLSGEQADCEFEFKAKADLTRKHLLYVRYFHEILPRDF